MLIKRKPVCIFVKNVNASCKCADPHRTVCIFKNRMDRTMTKTFVVYFIMLIRVKFSCYGVVNTKTTILSAYPDIAVVIFIKRIYHVGRDAVRIIFFMYKAAERLSVPVKKVQAASGSSYP